MLNLLLTLLILVCGLGTAASQSMYPLERFIKATSDVFALHVTAVNAGTRKQGRLQVRVYDTKFRLIKARVTPRTMILSGNGSRRVLVEVPFEGKKRRKIIVCTEKQATEKRGQVNIRTRVCGRFYAQRLG